MLNKNHEHQKDYYDKQSKPLTPIEIGDGASFQQDDKSYKPATVLSKLDDKLYVINAPNGRIFHSNRNLNG